MKKGVLGLKSQHSIGVQGSQGSADAQLQMAQHTQNARKSV
jgi:hypothetical protein